MMGFLIHASERRINPSILADTASANMHAGSSPFLAMLDLAKIFHGVPA